MTMRFVNADGLVSTGQGLIGTNMFAYCLNNPINMIDWDGCDPIPVWATNIINGTASEVDYAKALSVNASAWSGFARYTVDSAIAIATEHSTYDNYVLGYSEHHKKGSTNPANRNAHEKGQSRKQRDNNGEKGDARRKSRSNKRKPQNYESNYSIGEKILSGIIVIGSSACVVYLAANDVTVVGACDDAAIAPLLPIIWDNFSKVIA